MAPLGVDPGHSRGLLTKLNDVWVGRHDQRGVPLRAGLAHDFAVVDDDAGSA